MRIAIIGDPRRATALRRAFSGVAEVVDPGRGVHAVGLCCHPDDQAKTAYQVLGRGLPVLADLPSASAWDELELVLRESDRTATPYLPATWMRLTPAAQLARDALFRGSIGPLRSIDIAVPGEPGLMGTGFHGIDLAQFFLHRFSEVSAGATPRGRRIDLVGEDRTPCTVSLGEWKPNFAVIRGRRGMIELGWSESRIHREGQASLWIGERVDEQVGAALVAERFVECVADGVAPWTTSDDLAHLLEVLREAGCSLVREQLAMPIAA